MKQYSPGAVTLMQTKKGRGNRTDAWYTNVVYLFVPKAGESR